LITIFWRISTQVCLSIVRGRLV